MGVGEEEEEGGGSELAGVGRGIDRGGEGRGEIVLGEVRK